MRWGDAAGAERVALLHMWREGTGYRRSPLGREPGGRTDRRPAILTTEPTCNQFTVGVFESRLDQFLVGQGTGLTRSQLSRLIVDGHVQVNGKSVKPSNKVRIGDIILLRVPPPKPTGVVAQDIPLSVVYQDEHLVVIDKPAGCLLYTSPSPRDGLLSRMPSSA